MRTKNYDFKRFIFKSKSQSDNKSNYKDNKVIELSKDAEITKVDIHMNNTNNNNEEMIIGFKSLTYIIQRNIFFNKHYITLLDNISGGFHTNTINAIMGPSGAGKTTLLKCLNGMIFKGLTPESQIYLKSD